MRARMFVFAARLILAAALIVAGWSKAREPGAFIRDIGNFHLLPESWAYWTAALVPYLEIVGGLALVTGRQRRGAHLLIGIMLPVFLIFHASAWARGINIACGCFGGGETASTVFHPFWWITFVLALGAALTVSIRADQTIESSYPAEKA